MSLAVTPETVLDERATLTLFPAAEMFTLSPSLSESPPSTLSPLANDPLAVMLTSSLPPRALMTSAW